MPLRDASGRERGDSLEALAQDLGGMELRFAHANPGFESFGNALLVGPRLRLEGSSAEFLEGGSVIRTPAGAEKKIGRGCLAAVLSAEEAQSKFAVLATHWDHISEGERLTQARSLLQLRPSLCAELPHLLVGDLNAMRRSDYSPEQWAALEERNRQKGWGPPADSDALAFLDSKGYIDVHQSTWGLADGAAAAESRWTTAGLPGARIDYALASGGWAGGTLSAWVDTDASSSDHFPLVVDLLWP